ncbi:squamous cell carcinoma antigen recognized by T-cells 3 [Tetranychus urticae]|uniref:RRM domain-containing protein n=1 Tax=Tetranychus urticae TaxID=32264 RepID=T1L1N2_TETUR|nr:squamous cell carcinoma antigen recognized by T-cells 3 [Tetranychus urticae]
MVQCVNDKDTEESKNMSDEDSDEDDADYQDEGMDDNETDGSEDSDVSDGDDDDSSSDDDEDDVSDEKKLEEAKAIQDHLLDNPFDYDQHLKLIEIAGEIGDLHMINKARENMSSIFPLTPTLWLDWISTEKKLATDEEDYQRIIELFERALKDYVSVKLWLEYIYFVVMIPGETSHVFSVRKICERAINSVGLHVTEGSSVWIAYRTFESGIIELIDQKELVNQYKKIFDLYKRQLAIPLIGMEETKQEFHVWYEKAKTQCPGLDVDPESINYGYEQASLLLKKLDEFEQEIIASEPPHYEAYLKYIEYEEANGSPPRVQCIYERALIENCLQPKLWIDYAQYLDKKVQDLDLIKPIYERAVRNCPWTVNIWINYLRSLERNKADHETIKSVFEKSLETTFQSSSDYLDLWLTYLDYLRRRTDWNDKNQIEQLRKNFAAAVESLAKIGGDDSCSIPLYMAKIEAKYIKNMGEARRIWNELFQSRKDLTAIDSTWIEYANFEKLYGDDAHFKKALIRGLNSNVNYPETLGALLIKHIREESVSIAEFDEIMEQYEKAMTKVTKKREELTKKMEEEKSAKAKLKTGKFDKSKGSASQNVIEGEFKIPEPPGKSSNEEYKNKFKKSANAVKDEKVLAEMQRQASYKEKGDDERKLNTIVVKNLAYSVYEDKLRENFSKFGEIVDIRLVRNYKGQSAGYGFIEFAQIKSVKEALKHDRLKIDGRECYIDEMGKKYNFKFSLSRENNKLFVSNLDKRVTNEQLTSIFEKYGNLKDVRIATLRNGKSKGYAYIEYKSEVEANDALKANGMLVLDKTIKVQISDPSAKKSDSFLGSGLMQHSASNISAKRRINVPLIPLSVRKKLKVEESDSSATASTSTSSSLSQSNSNAQKDTMDTSLPSTSKV